MKKLLVALFLITQVPITAQDYKFGKVSKEELEEKFHPLDSAAEAVYFYNCIAVVFFYLFNGKRTMCAANMFYGC